MSKDGTYDINFNVDTTALDDLQGTLKEVQNLLAFFNNNVTITIKTSVGLNELLSIAASLVTIGGGIFAAIKSIKKIAQTEAENFGEALAKGLIQGIRNNMDKVKIAVKEYLSEPAKKIIITDNEISSPSKVYERFGKYLAEGLGVGITDGAKTATNAMESLSDNVVDASKSLTKIGDGAKDYKKSLDDVGDATDKVSKKKISFGGAFAIALTVISALVGFFQNLMATNEEFGAKVDKIWGKITEAFAPVVDAVMGLFDTFTTGGEGMGSVMDGITGIISGAADACFEF